LLKTAIQNTYKSYLNVLDVLVILSEAVEQEAERRKAKYIPKDEDLSFNTVFADNICMQYLKHAEGIKRELKNEQIGNANEEELIGSIYGELKVFEPYVKYINQKEYVIDDHRKILRDICKDFLPANEAFDQYMEASVPTWADDELIVLKKVDETLRALPLSQEKEDLMLHYELPEEEIEFAETLMNACIEESGRFDQMIIEKLKNWELDRVSLIDRILMKLAVTEFLYTWKLANFTARLRAVSLLMAYLIKL
jgi:N utilization substance protein B